MRGYSEGRVPVIVDGEMAGTAARIYDLSNPATWPQPEPEWLTLLRRLTDAAESVAESLRAMAAEQGAITYDSSPQATAQRQEWVRRLAR